MLLALDCFAPHASCALFANGKVSSCSNPTTHHSADDLLRLVYTLIQDNGIRLEDVDNILYTAGPGRMMALRTTCGIAQGLAYPYKISLVPISTLALMAWSLNADYVLSYVGAGQGKVYLATYHRSSPEMIVPLLQPGLYSLNNLPDLPSVAWHAVGNHNADIREVLCEHYHLTAMTDIPSVLSEVMLRFWQQMIANPRPVAATEATVWYLQDDIP